MYTDHEGQEQDLQKKDVMNCLDQEQMQAMQDSFVRHRVSIAYASAETCAG